MEISRRHLQDTERAELAELLSRPDPGPVEREAQARAAEMQRQVDGLTRNQRRVLNKRMRKAAKK